MDCGILFCVFDFDFAIWVRHGSDDVVERPQIRLDSYSAKSWARGANSGNYGQQIVVGMSAPGVGVGASRLRLFRPCGQAEGEQVAPRLQYREIFLAHTSMLQGAREIETKIVGGLRHRWKG